MNRALAWVTTAVLVSSTAATPQDASLSQLPGEFRRWLTDEVAYIITDREREIFLSLETAEERHAFVDVFWRKRDPNAATLDNEYRSEHYQRLEDADRMFQDIRSIPGRKTDRGRMYVILGPPRGRERFDAYNELVSAELWFYQGDPDRGIPRFFHLLFYKPQDAGVFRLYSPVLDGPGQLLRGQASAQPQLAFDNLFRISPELARASIAFDASQPVNRADVSAASLGTEMVIANIEELPKRAINTDYLNGWLMYGNRVSAEYSFNYVPSRSTFSVLLGEHDTRFVHFALEIDFENFPLETDPQQLKFYTTVDTNIEVRDRSGTLVHSDDKETFIDLTRSQVETMVGSAFSYHDSFPLIPGEYNVSVVLRNRFQSQYTVAESRVRVETLSPAMSDLVVAYDAERASPEASSTELGTFEIAGQRIQPAADGLFAIGDDVFIVLQIHDPLPDHALRIRFLYGETVVEELQVSRSELAVEPVVRILSAANAVSGVYRITADLFDAKGDVLLSKSQSVTLSPRTAVPRPAFTARHSFDPKEPGYVDMIVGDQLWAIGKYAEATKKLEDSVAVENPKLPMARWKLAGAYVREQKAAEAVALLEPVEPHFPQQYEVVLGLGLSYYLQGKLERASEYLERSMDIRAPGPTLLNTLADIYVERKDNARARELLERSLELDGSQDAVREKLTTLSNP